MFRIVGADGHQYGPVPVEQIRKWIAENRVNGQTVAFAEGGTDWKPLRAFPEFAPDFQAPPVPPGAPPLLTSPAAAPIPAATARASNKIPAGVCGILLGALGIHKFILGYTGAGLIMLLVTILSCGLLYPVMHIIGLIEGIIYLAKSDEEFVRTYVDNRHEWF